MLKKSLSASILVGLLLLAPAYAGPQAVGKTAGKTYGEWSTGWWQWMLSIPAAENPQQAEGPIDCTVAQSGSVWYLAGAPLGTTAVRSCTVPRGKNLFFPVLNGLFVNTEGESYTVAEKREQLDGLLNDTDPGPLDDLGFPGTRACGLFATIDGEPATYYVPDARVQSPPFLADTGDGPSGFPPGIVDAEAVSDGFWVLLPPLTEGEHTLRFGGSICEFDSSDDHPFYAPLDITYHLTVTGEAEEELTNVEIIQSLYTAFAVGDLDTILAILDENVVWIESEGIPYGGTYIGRDAVFEGVFAKIGEEWDDFTAQVDEMFAADGNRVIVRQRDGGTFKTTGKSMEAEAISIWTLDEAGRAVHFRQVIDTQEVVSATIP